jgi:FkbM family methyltransferase
MVARDTAPARTTRNSVKIRTADGEPQLTFSPLECAIFARSFRGKLRLARAYSNLRGLKRRPFVGVATVPLGRYVVDTREHADWALLFGSMEERDLRWLSRNLRGIGHAWDVGAHRGTYSVALARLIGPSGAVHAFEPFPASMAVLSRNLELNGVAGVVCTHPEAIADYVGRGTLQLSGIDSGKHSLIDAIGFAGNTVDVLVRTLDSVLDEVGVPDFVKIDIERAELDALRGAPRLLGLRRTTFLFESEVWDEGRDAVHALLREAGYGLTSLVRGREVEGVGGRMIIARPTTT